MKLNNVKVAILSEDGFEQSELLDTQKALIEAGAVTKVISPKKGKIKGWKNMDWGQEVNVDILLDEANPKDFDALLLPGGAINPDKLRMQPKAVEFVRHFFKEKKPVAAICHGPILLIEADVLKNRTITSWPSIKTDVKNAGGHWVDEQVVVDENLVTSRKPDDIPAFNEKMIPLFAQYQPAMSR